MNILLYAENDEKNTITKIKTKFKEKLAAGRLRFDLLVFELAATLESKTTCNLKELKSFIKNLLPFSSKVTLTVLFN